MYTNEQKYGLITKPEPEKISRYDLINKPEPDEIYHYGVKGMKWGVRRYQNEDGSLTPEGKRRAAKENEKAFKKALKRPEKIAKYYDKLTPDQIKKIKTKYTDIIDIETKKANVDSSKANSKAAKAKLIEERRKAGLLASVAFTAVSLTAVAKFLDTDLGKRTFDVVKNNAGVALKNINPNYYKKARRAFSSFNINEI